MREGETDRVPWKDTYDGGGWTTCLKYCRTVCDTVKIGACAGTIMSICLCTLSLELWITPSAMGHSLMMVWGWAAPPPSCRTCARLP
jgi:hypothetical protein